MSSQPKPKKPVWQKFNTRLRVAAVLILVVIALFGAYEVWDFYRDKVGFTPSAAVKVYFFSLGDRNYEEVYRLTAKSDLTDIYGRPITKAEFIGQLRRLSGDQAIPFTMVETQKLWDDRASYYYAVTLHSTVNGQPTQSRILAEVRREGKTWVVTYPFAIVL